MRFVRTVGFVSALVAFVAIAFTAPRTSAGSVDNPSITSVVQDLPAAVDVDIGVPAHQRFMVFEVGAEGVCVSPVRINAPAVSETAIHETLTIENPAIHRRDWRTALAHLIPERRGPDKRMPQLRSG